MHLCHEATDEAEADSLPAAPSADKAPSQWRALPAPHSTWFNGGRKPWLVIQDIWVHHGTPILGKNQQQSTNVTTKN